jgi:hypothetical protein
MIFSDDILTGQCFFALNMHGYLKTLAGKLLRIECKFNCKIHSVEYPNLA